MTAWLERSGIGGGDGDGVGDGIGLWGREAVLTGASMAEDGRGRRWEGGRDRRWRKRRKERESGGEGKMTIQDIRYRSIWVGIVTCCAICC